MIHNFNKIFFPLSVFLLLVLLNTTLTAQARIAVLYSNYTEKNPDINSHKVIDEITLWEVFLMQEKISYAVIDDSDLESGIQDDFDILILPNVNAISKDEINSIKEFLNEGNSVLSVGSRLNIDEKGNFFGDEYTNELFGIKAEKYWGKEKNINQLLSFNPFFDENLISAKLQVSTKYRPLICKTLNSETSSLGYIENRDNNYFQTSLIYGKARKGKIVWTGFTIDDIVGGNEQIKTFKQLILNSLKWLDKIPEIKIDNFPEDKNSAEIIAIKNTFNLKPELIDKLKQKNIKPYLIILPQQIIPNEIESKFSEDDFILDLSNLGYINIDSVQILIEKINEAKKRFKINFDKIIVPEQMINDVSLLDKIAEVGINYFLYPSDVSLLPKIADNRFFIVPFKVYGGNEELRGVNFITNKTEAICENNSNKDLFSTLSKIDRQINWVTDLEILKNWWINKSIIEVSLNMTDNSNAFVSVVNNGNEATNNISLILNWPFKFYPSDFSVNEGVDIIDYKFLKTGEINLNIDRLESRQSKRLNLNFDQD